MTTLLSTAAVFALVVGGGAPAAPTKPATAAAPITVPAVAPGQSVRPVVPVLLHYQGDCVTTQSQEPSCPSGNATLSAEQVQTLARLFGLKAEFRPAQPGEAGPLLDLSVTESRLGLNGIGTPPSYMQSGAAYYPAAQVISFIAQVTPGAYFTATPRLTLHTDRATLDMGPASPQRQREFFSELAPAAAQALLPHILDTPLSCEKDGGCTYPGTSTIVWGEERQRVQTGLQAGEMALVLMAGTQLVPSGDPGVLGSVAAVEPGGWATFYLPSAPGQVVNDPKQITLNPEDSGKALLVRLTNTPVDRLAEGLIQPR